MTGEIIHLGEYWWLKLAHSISKMQEGLVALSSGCVEVEIKEEAEKMGGRTFLESSLKRPQKRNKRKKMHMIFNIA